LWITNPYSSTKSAVAYNTTSAAWVPSDTIAAETVDGDNDGQTYQVAFDPTDNGHVWLTESWKGWLERYMPGATSSSQALTNIYAGYSAFGLAIGGDGTIWTAIQDMNNNTTTAIYGYASGSTTSATPVYQILTIPNCNYSLNMLTISP
jgi:streptogramin lyase